MHKLGNLSKYSTAESLKFSSRYGILCRVTTTYGGQITENQVSAVESYKETLKFVDR